MCISKERIEIGFFMSTRKYFGVVSFPHIFGSICIALALGHFLRRAFKLMIHFCSAALVNLFCSFAQNMV